MEQRGQQPAATGQCARTRLFGRRRHQQTVRTCEWPRIPSFIGAVEWGEDYIDYFVDNYLFQRITPETVTGDWVYNTPFFLLLNVAVGVETRRLPHNGYTLPQSMYVGLCKSV